MDKLVDEIALILNPGMLDDYHLRHPGPLSEREKMKAHQDAKAVRSRETARTIIALVEKHRASA